MGSRRDEDVDRELQAHLDLEIEEQLAAGKTPREAREAAMRVLGNLSLVREQVRELSPWRFWDQVRQDVRYGLRTFGRSPAFALTAVLTLALGIGANAAIFSVIDALLLRPLPVLRPGELIVIDDTQNENFSYPDFVALRDGDSGLAQLLASSSTRPMPIEVGADPDTATVKIVSDTYFQTLGLTPHAGRLLAPGDDAVAAAVMGHAYWTRRFNRAPDVIGRSIRLNDVPMTIVGVSPPGFFGETPGESPEIWASMALPQPGQLRERGFSWLYLIGRLPGGHSAQQAQTHLVSLFAASAGIPAASAGSRIEVSPGARGLSRWRARVGAPLQVLALLVGLVLLLACANLATLLLTRGTARQHEIAMRLAIGASRTRIVRQLLTESLLLAVMGGALSLVLAVWGARLLVRMASAVGTGPALELGLGLDGSLLLFVAVTSLAAGALFGLLPALREVGSASRRIAVASERVVGTDGGSRLRGALIATQIALSLTLMTGSLLFVRTLQNLKSQDLGFQAEGLLRVEVQPARGYRPPPETVRRLLERASSVPGVQSATVAVGGTLANIGGVTGVEFPGVAPRDENDRRARADWVGPAYFRTAGIRLAAGRDFALHDDGGAPRVAILNQTAARYHLGSDTGAIGRRFTWNRADYEVVGVAADAKYADLREQTPRMIYFPVLQTPNAGVSALEIRSRSDAAALALGGTIREAVADVDARLRVGSVSTLSERVDRTLGREHMVTRLSGAFGAITLVLVSIGVYGSVAYSAGRRMKELGVRIALGARRGEVIRLVLRELVVVVLAGVAVGLAAGWVLGRLVQSLLFGLSPGDLPSLAATAGILMATSSLAALVPAVRASRLDPARVLRD